MTAAVATTGAVAADAVALPAPADRGRTTVSGRALRSVAAAAAAAELGVAADDVGVTLADDRGRLAVVVRTPVAAGLPADPPTAPGARGGDARPVLDRAEAARARVAAELAALGGAGVGSCRLVVTAVVPAAPRPRVDRRPR